MFDETIRTAAADALAAARAAGATIATAESCTGGLVAGALTEFAGSSDAFERGWVTYSNEAKTAELGVPEHLFAMFGAVSADVAQAMADGARQRSGAGAAVSVTGIAGPGGGSLEKPVGLVWFGLATASGRVVTHETRFGDIGRSAVRRASVAEALALLRGAFE